MIVPPAAVLVQITIDDPAVAFSPQRVNRNSAPLLDAIEQHRAARSCNPVSTLAAHGDISPGVMGVEMFHNERSHDVYSLVFEHHTFRFGAQEFVVYNKHVRPAMTSNRIDLLELTPEALALEQSRGRYAVHDASNPNWSTFGPIDARTGPRSVSRGGEVVP